MSKDMSLHITTIPSPHTPTTDIIFSKMVSFQYPTNVISRAPTNVKWLYYEYIIIVDIFGFKEIFEWYSYYILFFLNGRIGKKSVL